MKTRTQAAIRAMAATSFAVMLLTAPALAHHKDGHAQGGGKSSQKATDNDGDADSDRSTSYTEDDDTNDGGTPNNVSDEGDNRHPSGKDRSVEGSSGNQGRSESDPDDDGRGPDRSNGGPDKPNGSGGSDKADQDGNNGCGNDDDFEDDNEGWCGKPPVAGTTTAPGQPVGGPEGALPDTSQPDTSQPDGSSPDTSQSPALPDLVLGSDIGGGGPEPDAGVKVAGDDAAVTDAGERDVTPAAVLPLTGGSVTSLIALAGMLVAAGLGLVGSRRRQL